VVPYQCCWPFNYDYDFRWKSAFRNVSCGYKISYFVIFHIFFPDFFNANFFNTKCFDFFNTNFLTWILLTQNFWFITRIFLTQKVLIFLTQFFLTWIFLTPNFSSFFKKLFSVKKIHIKNVFKKFRVKNMVLFNTKFFKHILNMNFLTETNFLKNEFSRKIWC